MDFYSLFLCVFGDELGREKQGGFSYIESYLSHH